MNNMIINNSFTSSIIICIVIALMLIIFGICMIIITIKEHKENKWKNKFKQEFISGYFFAYGNYMANFSRNYQKDPSKNIVAKSDADRWAENDFFESLKEWFPKKYLSEFSKDYFMDNKNSWIEEAMREVDDVVWWERIDKYNSVWAHRKFEYYPNQEYVPIGMI